MKKIFVRSPYFIEIDEVDQTSGKIEIYLWNKGTSIPTTPTYTLEKEIPSQYQTKLSWNVANYAKEYIKPIAPVLVSVPTEDNVKTWCYMKVVRYSDNVELDDETFICLNGYTNFLGGYNQNTTEFVFPLVNTNIKLTTFSNFNYIDVWIEENTDFVWQGNDEYFFTPESEGLWKLPYDYDPYTLVYEGGEIIFGINTEQLCEPKYTPITCSFINRFGGWQFLTFFKANQQSIDVNSKNFNLMPQSLDYNTLIGSNKSFNFSGTQKITCNTGWVDQNYFELIQDLLLSETILLDNIPVICKSNSADYKTHLKEKNINYTINFEYNFNLINDVI
jgi:hypothetical protein